MDFAQALRFSRYASAVVERHPAEARKVLDALDAPFDWHAADAALATVTGSADAGGADAFAAHLRQLRRRVMLHTVLRDLTGRAGLAEVCAAITRLADTAIVHAVAFHHCRLAAVHGEALDAQGTPQQLVVVGMGKLGGAELNVSSDVDLVFVYPEEGDTIGPRPLSHREFFERLGRRVIAALNDVTGDGFVFRVDMRLRPYGESGPLAVPFSALEQYLVTQGRAWERYAWLKARALTGNRHDELMALVTPFVYRKYLDFDAYEGLRDIHRQIRQQGRRKDYEQNVKLGPGGIRELEFTVQALQLVRGGREPALRERGTLAALAVVGARGLLSDGAVRELSEAYAFLRDLEHRLQYRDDAQTQSLPTTDEERAAVAAAMDCADVQAFEAALARRRSVVETHFEAVFGAAAHTPAQVPGSATNPSGTLDPLAAGSFAALWRDELSAEAATSALAQAGYRDPAALLATLQRVRTSARYRQLPALSQQRVDALIPRLLAAATRHETRADAQDVFVRLLGLLEAVSRRSAYLALLVEHPPLLPRLAHLMGASAWAADYLTRHPILLDELLDARVLLAQPEWSAWRAELARVLHDHVGDAERQMDALRHFQQTQTFRLLAQDLAGQLTIERLADHLSALADLIIEATLRELWRQMQGVDAQPPRFAVIGYGKLGGKELGYASDLDLVFLYDDADEDAFMRYTRLAQRLNTWLGTTTAAGTLYETDLRLRPDGAKGLTVSSWRGFCRYQRENAWTWEHQALTRARYVTGDRRIGAAFEAEREAILRLPRDPAKLAAEVVEMRLRMYAGHPNPTQLFDVKHDGGGMVDIEFTVQYLVLAHAARHASLTRNLGNIALLRIAADLALLPQDLAANAAAAYRHYRRRQHELRLTGAAHARVDAAPEAQRRESVRALWKTVFGGPWDDAPGRTGASRIG